MFFKLVLSIFCSLHVFVFVLFVRIFFELYCFCFFVCGGGVWKIISKTILGSIRSNYSSGIELIPLRRKSQTGEKVSSVLFEFGEDVGSSFREIVIS